MKASRVLYYILQVAILACRTHRLLCESLVQCAGPTAVNQDIQVEICLMLVVYRNVSRRPSLAHIAMVEFDKVELVRQSICITESVCVSLTCGLWLAKCSHAPFDLLQRRSFPSQASEKWGPSPKETKVRVNSVLILYASKSLAVHKRLMSRLQTVLCPLMELSRS